MLRRQALGWLGGGVLGGIALAGGSSRAASLARLQIADDAAAPQLYDDDMILGKAESGDMDYDTFFNLVKDLLPKA